jgi:hypothetical protein
VSAEPPLIGDHFQRVGEFEIPYELYLSDMPTVRKVHEGCVFIRGEARLDRRKMIFHALRDDFDPIPHGETAPCYDWQVVNGHCRWTRRQT